MQKFKFHMHHKPLVVEFEISDGPQVTTEAAAIAFAQQYPGWVIDSCEEITQPVLPN